MTSTTIMNIPIQKESNFNKASCTSAEQEIFRLTPNREKDGSPLKVHTSSAPLSAKEQKALDELAMLFTIQEERCLSEAGRERESSHLSKSTLTSSQLASDASFIYQHIDFGVLGKCVPGFVKSHLNKNGRYLPETFILRVNFWRRRRALGDDSSTKRAAKNVVVRPCTEHPGPSSSRAAVSQGRSPRPQTVTTQQSASAASGVVLTVSSR